MKKTFTFLTLMFGLFLTLAQTVYSENIGTPTGTTAIGSYTGWQNTTPIVYSGTASVRNTSASSGYTGFSGGGNVFFSGTAGQTFEIHGINTSAYNSAELQLSFGFITSTASAAITLETSTNAGANWTPVSVPVNSNTSWALKTITSGIPSASDLWLRFTGVTSTSGMRVDDLKITNVSASCALSLGAPTTNCDAVTSNLDTYTATIPFTGGGTATYTITPTSGTVSGDNPSTVASGNILITGVSEGVNNSVTITGGTCNYTIPITASVCKPINTLPINEHFNYTVGNSLSSQQLWTSLNSGDDILVSAGNLTFSGITSSGNSISFVGSGAESLTPFTSKNSGVVSAAFLFSSTDYSNVTTDLANTYFALFTADNSGATSSARLWIRKNGTKYQFGLGAGTSPDTWSANLYDVGTTQYLTLSYDFANNKLYLFENEFASVTTRVSASPTVSVVPTSAIANIGGFMLRQDSNTLTPTIVIDELTINTDALTLSTSDFNSLKANFIKNTIVFNEINFGLKANVKVYSMDGTLVKSAVVDKNVPLNISTLSKGTYIVAGEVNGKKVSQKIIKQ